MIASFPAQAPEPPAPGFNAPGVADFDIPPIFEGVPVLEWVDKPVLQLVFSVVVIWGFFHLATRRVEFLPGRLQYTAERFHHLVRDGIARDNIGPEFRKYVPYLVALFAFLLVNNLFGILPLVQLPTLSHPGMAYALAGVTWLIYNIIGIRKHGVGGYFKLQTWPAGVPAAVRIVLTPLEFLSNIILRPVTLAYRLFGNMFAGHLLLLVFIFGFEYMLLIAGSLTLNILSPFAGVLAIVFTGFEAFVQVIQAYIFTILTASYIGGSLAEEH